MKQIFQNPKTGETKVEELTSPKLRPGGVLVQNKFSVISPGTERNIISVSKKNILQKAKERPDYVKKFLMLVRTKGIKAAWEIAKSKLDTEIALGYSTSGKVLEAGRETESLKAGDRVACAGQNYASHAEIIYVPKNLAVKIPDNVTNEEAAFTTLGAIAMQGIRRAELSQGEKVAVIGLGLIGQLAVRILKAYGHPVIGIDIQKNKINLAVKNGADLGLAPNAKTKDAVNLFTNNKGADAVLIYASAKDSKPLDLAVEICREKGRIVQIGNIDTKIPWRDFYKKELTYHSSNSYGPGRYDETYEEEGHDYPFGYVRWTEQRNMEEVLRLLSEKSLKVDDLITKKFKIENAASAYETVLKPSAKATYGILLEYGETKPSNTLKLDGASPTPAPQKFINIGIIGVGSFMTSTILPHLKELIKIQKREDIKIRAVCNSTGKIAKKIAEEWSADYITNDYKKIIDDKTIDLIICATRHSSHTKIAEDALKADKNLYMEKPLALNDANLKKVMRAARESKGRLFVGFNRRFSTHLRAAKEEFKVRHTPLMAVYRVNYPLFDKNHWSYDPQEGGRILGEDCHFVDSLNYIIGAGPKRIYTSVIPKGGSIEHEENVIVNLEYPDGSLATIFYSALGAYKLPKEYIEIYAGGRTMLIDNFKSSKLFDAGKAKTNRLWHQDKGFSKELELLMDAIKDGKPSPISLEEIQNSHQTTFKIIESYKTGKVVEF